jgi:hypothetical protein
MAGIFKKDGIQKFHPFSKFQPKTKKMIFLLDHQAVITAKIMISGWPKNNSSLNF